MSAFHPQRTFRFQEMLIPSGTTEMGAYRNGGSRPQLDRERPRKNLMKDLSEGQPFHLAAK